LQNIFIAKKDCNIAYLLQNIAVYCNYNIKISVFKNIVMKHYNIIAM